MECPHQCMSPALAVGSVLPVFSCWACGCPCLCIMLLAMTERRGFKSNKPWAAMCFVLPASSATTSWSGPQCISFVHLLRPSIHRVKMDGQRVVDAANGDAGANVSLRIISTCASNLTQYGIILAGSQRTRTRPHSYRCSVRRRQPSAARKESRSAAEKRGCRPS